MNLAFGFIVKNIEDGRFWCFHAHENNTLLYGSKLVCTKDYLTKLKGNLNKTDVIESCSRERLNTKWRFNKLTNLTVFAALLKDIPMECKTAVLAESLFTNGTIYYLTYEEIKKQLYYDNVFVRLLSICTALNDRNETTSKIFNLSLNKMDGLIANQSQGVHLNDFPIVENMPTLNILLSRDIVDRNIIGELARRSLQKYENTVRLLKYNNRICYVNNNNAVFQSLRCPNCYTFSNWIINL